MAGLSDITGKRRPDYWQRRIIELERAVQTVRTARSAQATQIGSGGTTVAGGQVTVLDPAGNVLLAVGTRTDDPSVIGLETFRGDGRVMFRSMGAGFLGLSYTGIYDGGGNAVVQDHPAYGGLQRPFLSLGQMVDASAPGSFPASPTSTTWVTMQTAYCQRQNPACRWDAMVSSSDASTTGNVQLVDANGVVIGAPIPVPPGAVSYVSMGPVLWPDATWSWGDAMYLSVQAQRTGGTGAIGVRTTGLWGMGNAA
jgi:hypothetical protein